MELLQFSDKVKKEAPRRIIVPSDLDQPLPWDPAVRKGRDLGLDLLEPGEVEQGEGTRAP